MSALMFGVMAPERLPIWKHPGVSSAERRRHVRGMAYTSTVHTVIDSAERLESSLHHVVHTGFIGDVDFHDHRLERGVFGEQSTLIGSGQRALLVDVCKNHGPRSSFSKGNGGFFANAAGGLKEPSQ